jgi:hypothetical protein
MTTDVRPPIPSKGLSQNDLASFGAVLAHAGLPQSVVDELVHELQAMATEASFKGSAALLQILQREDVRKRRDVDVQVDSVLRTLREQVRALKSSRMLPGYVDRAAVVGAIQALLTTPEPSRKEGWRE